MSVLSPTPRTTVTRGAARAVDERQRMHVFLRQALAAHLGVVVTRDGITHPLVLPVAFAVDAGGPDADGSLYVHGSTGAGWLSAARGADVCVTVTEVDGLVLARSAFHHSVNYRSVVVLGRARLVEDPAERQHALDLIVDHLVPGRAATLRASTRKELAATAVLAVPLAEASMKERSGGPVDDEADLAAGGWAGHLPLRRVASPPVADTHADSDVPTDVAALARRLR